MNPERWQKIKGIFDAAVELAPAKRGKFLKKACGADVELRREVERLLASFETAESFMESPAAAEVASLIVEKNEKIKSGEKIAHYETLRQIGEGGMGEVYLAKDTRLNRRIALKILPAHLTADKSRLQRFEQEAQAASALNHPNIITIHEIGKENNIHFISTEFVEGETLRQRISGNSPKALEVLDIAAQIASALAVAHSAGVVHRDIKPENVMIRPDGIVKLLDFGLAKLTETSVGAQSSDVSTGKLTNPGTVMGTVNYMSPEQAQGAKIDRRTDLWSLGVCLYEMLTGVLPFSGKTVNHTLVAIMEQKPLPLPQHNSNTSAKFERIVAKLLAKDRERRYQTANDLLADLRKLQKRIESEPYQAESQLFTAPTVELLPEENFIQETSSGIVPNNLSGQLLPLVGREKEIAEIENLLRRDDVRLLTLTGIGGTGKTRLAFEIAQKMLSEFADGVFFIPLAAVRNSEFVASEIARPLGVKDAGGKSLLEMLKDFLREKQILLVVDNFEQILSATPVLNELLAAAPRLKILVTSRSLLRLRVEREFVVPPLDVPSDIAELSSDDLLQYESVKLFTERAQAVKSNLAATKENLQIVAEICSRLDGLPLAIELAAARVKILSPNAILSRLESSLKLLTGGAQDLPAHQQTMRGAIEWSYDLLDEQEKILFRRLAVFAGGFTIESAEAVVEEEKRRKGEEEIVSDTQSVSSSPLLLISSSQIEVLDGIASLVDKSLLVQKEQADGESRFRLLEVVREYASEILQASGESEMMRKKHAAFFLKLAQDAEPQILGEQGAKWLALIEEEHNNFRAAFSWAAKGDAETAVNLAGTLRDFWVLRNQLTEGREWFETALEQAGNAPAAARFKLLNGLGQAARFQGDYAAAQKAFQEGLTAGKESNDLRQIAVANRGLAAVAKGQDDFTTARKFYEEALIISRKIDEKFGIAVSLNALGDLARVEGNYAAARLLFEESLVLCRELGNKQGMGCTLNNLGAVDFALSDYETARSRFAEGLTMAQELGEKITSSYSLDGFAALAVKSGDTKRATQLAGAAEHLRESLGFDTEPAERRFRDAYLTELQSVLDEGNFAVFYEQGRALTLKKAVVLALQKLNAGNGEAIAPLQTSSEKQNATESIAILPFLTVGLNEDEQYLGLGLADALITQLSQTRQLTVRPTNAVRHYLNQKQDAMEIGRELRVGAVLGGNLQRAGENLRVTVQLINTESDATLWAEKFNLKFTDFFEVQDQIAEKVSRALLLKLNSEERERMTKRYTDNNAAYLEYLKGRYQWNKREVEGFNRAVGHFKAAIDHDPTFALAYAGLADAYSMLPMWGEGTSHDFCPRAKAAARKALEIDENLAEAHASLGYVKYVYDWDFAGAENSYRRAIALNPNYALVRAWYAKFLVVMRRFDEAFEQIKLAYALDPLSPQTGASFGGFYLYSGQYDEAIRHYGKMLQMTPNFVPALLGLGQSYGQKGLFKEAVEMHEKAVLHSAEHPILLGVLACSKALAGERDEALKIVEKLEQSIADCPMLPYSIATVYACLNEKQAAFEWLEKAYTERNSHLPDINIDPEFDNLRDDLRFEDLLRRIGLN